MTAVYEVRSDLELVRSPQGVMLRDAAKGKSFPISEEEGWLLLTLAETKGSIPAASTVATAKGITLTKAKLEALARALLSRGLLVERVSDEPAPTVAYPISLSAKTNKAPVQAHDSARTAESLAHVPTGADAPPEPVTVLDSTARPSGGLAPSDLLPAFRADLVVRADKPGRFLVGDRDVGTFISMHDFELSLARLLNGKRTAAEVVGTGERLGLPVTMETLNTFIQRFQANGFLLPVGKAPTATKATSTWRKRRKWTTGVRELFRSGMRLLNQGRPADAKPFFKALLEADPKNTAANETLKRLGGRTRAPLPAHPERPPSSSPTPVPRDPSRPPVWFMVLVVTGLMAAGATVSWLVLSLGDDDPPEVLPPPLPAVPVALPELDAGPPQPHVWVSHAVTVQARALADVVAPASGRFWPNPVDRRDVTVGKPVGSLRRTATGLRDAIAGARRVVTELEAANEDTDVPDESLQRARDALNRLVKESNANSPVVAPADGHFVPESEAPSNVVAGQRLGIVVDGTTWAVKASFPEPPAPDAVCTVSNGLDGGVASCLVITTSGAGAATDVSAHVAVSDAPWLDASMPVTMQLTGR
ncbi:MAG: hypothetical protein JNG84_00870 [Archangium sp.]|nr:hypothetical protein [Archangium sp.]